MKGTSTKTLYVAILLFCFAGVGYAQQLSFEYDAAGNQTKREFICIGCTTFAPASAEVSKVDHVAKVQEKGLTESAQKIIAYPNPVTETLNIKWTPLETYVTLIEVYSTMGISSFKKSYRYEEAEFHETIQFSKMTPGMYVVRVMFSDGKQELLKIIKQ